MKDARPAVPGAHRSLGPLIGRLLQVGVLASAALILSGWIWARTAREGGGGATSVFSANLRKILWEEVTGAAREGLDPRSLVRAGILVLVLTPYLRVLLSFVHFVFVDRNWKYGLITGFVLAALTYSVWLR